MQDTAHLALNALSAAGIPTRYVYGYLHLNPNAEIRGNMVDESHARIEWFCGEQWRGYDPPNLIDVGDRHVLVG